MDKSKESDDLQSVKVDSSFEKTYEKQNEVSELNLTDIL